MKIIDGEITRCDKKMRYNNKTLKISDKLMKRISKYDSIAFEELYNQAGGAVFGLAMSILANHSDAEDVVQNTFISIYCPNKSSFLNYGILNNKQKICLKKYCCNNITCYFSSFYYYSHYHRR